MKCAAWTNTKTQTSVCAGYPRLNSWTLNFVLIGIQFLRATARICHANPVRLSVCPSVTRVYCVKTAERIIEILSPSDRPNILVFRHQRSLRKSDGFTPNGGAKYKGVAKTRNFRPICGCISETARDRGIVTMEDE